VEKPPAQMRDARSRVVDCFGNKQARSDALLRITSFSPRKARRSGGTTHPLVKCRSIDHCTAVRLTGKQIADLDIDVNRLCAVFWLSGLYHNILCKEANHGESGRNEGGRSGAKLKPQMDADAREYAMRMRDAGRGKRNRG